MFYLFVLVQKWCGQYRPWQKVVGACPTLPTHKLRLCKDQMDGGWMDTTFALGPSFLNPDCAFRKVL